MMHSAMPNGGDNSSDDRRGEDNSSDHNGGIEASDEQSLLKNLA